MGNGEISQKVMAFAMQPATQSLIPAYGKVEV